MSVYRVHAAELYRKALADPTFIGLQKSRAEMRVALAKDHLTLVAETVHVAEEQIAPPPPGCDFKINGNTATMVFPNGATMEFAKCPAGEFQMLYDYEKERTVPVKITRPFWFSKEVLKHKHLDSPTFKRRSDDDQAFVWEHWKFLDGNETKFFPRVNADFKKLLPKGYVIRLPSMAEFEYAYHANTKDRNDIFYCYNHRPWKDAGERMKNGNKWGIKDLFRWSVFMDRIDPTIFGEEVDGPKKWRVSTCYQARRLHVKPDAKDPFFWSEKNGACVAIKGVMLSPERAWAPYDQIAQIACHIVIGPDLVKEWKEKQAKKK